MGGCIALGAAIGLVAGLLIGSSPAPKAPPVQPPPPPVQPAASSFAEELTNYGGSGTAYQAYEVALKRDVVGGNADLVSSLVGFAQVPGDSVQSQAAVISVAVTWSAGSQAELYVVVQQLLTTPYTNTTHHKSQIGDKQTQQIQRRLLLDLTMVRQGQKWLVNAGQISIISTAGGALAPNGGTS